MVTTIVWLIWSRPPEHREASAEYLTERFWIDRVSEDPRELAEVIFLLDEIGMTDQRSRYHFSFDFNQWALEEDELRLHVLQSDRHLSYKVDTWKCAPGESPHEMLEYCMTLKGPSGTRRYYASEKSDEGMRALLASAVVPVRE